MDDVIDRLAEHQGWEQQGHWLVKQFEFDDFAEALAFVNQVGEIAEELNHHPDIALQNYNEVALNLTTHDVEGITDKDFTFVDRVEELDAV
jgi:4a-hydroxytetrahydrobiopterin dehydratase